MTSLHSWNMRLTCQAGWSGKARRLVLRKTALMAYTGQCEKTVQEWLTHFRAHKLVRIAEYEKDSRGHMQVARYKWNEVGEPTEDAIHRTAPASDRARAYRERQRKLKAVNDPTYQPRTVFAGAAPW